MKEMTSVATTMMTEEEKAEMEKELNEGRGVATPAPSVTADAASAATQPTNGAGGTPAHSGAVTPSPLPSPGEEGGSGAVSPTQDRDGRKKKSKLSPEQKKKLQELEDERRKNMEERIDMLTKKLVERLRPFVEAKHPGDKDDPETKAFEDKIRREVDDLKLESFGVEVSGSRC